MTYLIIYYTVTYCNAIVCTSKISKDFIDNFVETHNGCKIVNTIKMEDSDMRNFCKRRWIF